jgi:hypothetical protein
MSIRSTVKSNMSDKVFIYLQYYQSKKRLLNLRNPKTYSEKLQWTKIYGELEQYSMYADKLTVRPYIKDTIGEKYLIPLLGHWDNFDDIDFNALPNQFVLKATHGSGYNFLCTDKAAIDMPALKKEVASWTEDNFYDHQREVQYKHLKPHLVAEHYLEDESGELRDYKFTCSKGNIDFIELHSNRVSGHNVQLMDKNWVRLPFETIAGEPHEILPKPANYDEVLTVVSKLAHDFPFVRVDLYLANGQIYFGELTYTPGDGTFPFVGESDLSMGKLIDLSGFKKWRARSA